MPYQIKWETSAGAHKRFYGALSVNDVMKSSIELHRDHRFDRLRYSINDFSHSQRERKTNADYLKDALTDLSYHFGMRRSQKRGGGVHDVAKRTVIRFGFG